MTGKVGNMSNYPHGFGGGLTVRGMPLNLAHPGKVFWVYNGSSLYGTQKGGSNSNKGTYNDPFSTIDYAIGQCTAGRGDIIMVKPGHSETLSAAITCDVAGVAIVGLGWGTARPQLTGAVAADLVSVTADNVFIHGLYWNEKTTASATTASLNIAAANCTVQNCHWDCGANEVLGVTVTAAGEIPHFVSNEFVVTANGPDNFIQIEGVVDQPTFINNLFVTSDGTDALDDGGAVSLESQAVTNPVFSGNKVMSGGVTCNMLVNHGSATGVYSDEPYVVTGEMDIDVSESDYTTVGGITMLTITPTGPLTNVTLDLDNNKASTGLLVANTTETVQYVVERKVDGTNWRVTDHWPAASSKTGLAVPDAANDLDAADDGVGVRFNIGNVGPDEEVRINVELSAETGGDAEVPFALTFQGSEPVLTAVAAA